MQDLTGKKLLILKDNKHFALKGEDNILSIAKDCFIIKDSACENYFDILGWINGEF